MNTQELLQLRKRHKARKPLFEREDSHKIMALRGTGWRRPNGLHSKMHHRYRGQPALIEPGWGSPRAVRGLHPLGLTPVLIANTHQLEGINAKTQGVVIAASVGTKKRLEILARTQEKKLTVLNIKNPSQYVAEQKQKREEKKQDKSTKTKSKQEKQAAKKEELSKKVETAESKDEKKKELDKMLTKKEN